MRKIHSVTRDELIAVVREIERERTGAADGIAAAVRGAVLVPAGMPDAPAVLEPNPAAPHRPAPAQDPLPLFDVAAAPAQPAPVRDAFQSVVPLIIEHDSHLEIADMIWGYRVSWNAGPVFNARAETALGAANTMWDDSLRNRRCVIASHGFFEPHATETVVSARSGKPIKRQYRFTLAGDANILFMAGVYEGGRFSVMTCAPNRWVRSVHDRMPVVLRANEVCTWLGTGYAQLLDRANVALASQPAN